MFYFLFGISVCLNFILIFIGYKIYKKYIPVFRSGLVDTIDKDFFDL